MSSRLSIRVADVTISIGPLALDGIVIPDADQRFLVESPNSDLQLETGNRAVDFFENRERLFHSERWDVFRSGKRFLFRVSSGTDENGEPRVLSIVVNEYATVGDISIPMAGEEGPALYPLQYPVHEILMAAHLATRGGIELHACGVVDRTGRATLFVGTSGAGKSTLCTFMKKYENLDILSDDRIIVRKREGEWWAYGTPWHGDARCSANRSARLGQVFLLEQAKKIETFGVTPSEGALLLLRDSFPTYWSREKMEGVLATLDGLCGVVPVAKLHFTRGRSVLENTLRLG